MNESHSPNCGLTFQASLYPSVKERFRRNAYLGVARVSLLSEGAA